MNQKSFQVFFKKYWVLLCIGAIFTVQVIVMYGFGEHIYASAHDNLELHILDYHLLSENHLFFSHDTVLPILNGISRDYFFSEFSIYSFLYLLLPTCYAYITGYLLKSVVGFFSCILLAKYMLKDSYVQYRNLIWIISFTFASLPLYPAFALGFVSIPLLVYILLRIQEKPSIKWYVALFIYPLFSYFTFFGVFILGYLLLAIIYQSVKKHRLQFSLIGALFVLAFGYIAIEYRLFYVMLFSNVETIRATMIMDDWSVLQVLEQIGTTFVSGIFHAEACQKYLVMPICVVGFIILNALYIRKKEYSKMRKDSFNFTMVFILFNCLIYGLYGFKPLRELLETIIPVIKGLQLNRTVFFNTFLWYVAFLLLLMKLWNTKWQKAAYGVSILALIIVIVIPAKYNDFYHTCFNHFYTLVRNTPSNNLDYQEYYSEDLMEQIKADINYQGEPSVAFGLNPAILQYSNIWTLDGCISYYSQEYKEQFRQLIAPALEHNESSRIYYDDWGARAYIYSASDEDIYASVRNYEIQDRNLYMDTDAFREMGGKYIFSRIEIGNITEKNIELVKVYTDSNSPYVIYLYKFAD